ncbi:ThuA domain-containing protein [Paenibacillus sinopodophylli]|uniref:ThuA domain-containing protein n=1 Tax=Paenibacillus sinopodophylli TaxID=1837342 RepID=UPI00110CBADF|nr:ThuA domain-containing protein [Paenibacillus sinopodophylli]
MKIGVICGDYWHPRKLIMDGLELLREHGYQLDYLQLASEWSQEWMAQYDAIVLAKSNELSAEDRSPWLTQEIQEGFRSYVEGGKGLLVLHAGTVGYRNEPIFYELIGGVFTHHPEACPVTITSTDEQLDVTAGVASFTVHDEHYFMETLDERIKVFLQSESEHGTQPAGWIREQGNGRVCVLTPGHFLHVLQLPEYQNALKRAINWVGAGQH